jgi:uncharacterized protein with HEPN domain
MRPEEGDAAWLWDMIGLAEKAMRSLRTITFEEFLENGDQKELAVHRLTVLGEAANRISSSLQARHPDVPWRKIVGQRNALIHGYDDIDYEIVWTVVRERLPELTLQLKGILNLLDSNSGITTDERT